MAVDSKQWQFKSFPKHLFNIYMINPVLFYFDKFEEKIVTNFVNNLL